MFTGIIKEVGVIKSLKSIGDGLEITVLSEAVNKDAAPDDSIAVNGVCLTVVKKDSVSFTVQAVRETVARTNIKILTSGSKVNLEQALRPDDRLGGHIVQGHVDGTGEIIKVIKNDNGREFRIKTDSATARYIVEKGSVCLDGISLTVAELEGDIFRVAVIPHTEKNTTAENWRAGTKINIETDIIGRYIEKFISTGKNGLTIEKLYELGY
jgi:riboflavin synthase